MLFIPKSITNCLRFYIMTYTKSLVIIICHFSFIISLSIRKDVFSSSMKLVIIPKSFVNFAIIPFHDSISLPLTLILGENLACISSNSWIIFNLNISYENKLSRFLLLNTITHILIGLIQPLDCTFCLKMG